MLPVNPLGMGLAPGWDGGHHPARGVPVTCWDGTSTLRGSVLAPCGVVSLTPWGGVPDPVGWYLRPYWGGFQHPKQDAAHHPPNAPRPVPRQQGRARTHHVLSPSPPPRVSPQRCC